jgi:hypothetical protein
MIAIGSYVDSQQAPSVYCTEINRLVDCRKRGERPTEPPMAGEPISETVHIATAPASSFVP